jgi:hypothetical protein
MPKYCIGFFIVLLFCSCKKETESFSTASLSDYYPLQEGKYITYNLDSTIFIEFGVADTVLHYQVQDRVDKQITDNSGRTAFRIIRFIRQNAAQDWIPNNSFMVTPTDNSIEVVEDNLRFIKLKQPVRENYTWKGNSYITSEPYPSYQFGSDFISDWDYTYKDVGAPTEINSLHFDSTITVSERDDVIGDPAQVGDGYAEKTFSVEKYAKGIGLIYREFLHWEYQGAYGTYTGFGIKMAIIDHN